MRIFGFLNRQRPDPVAFEAYWHKLPDRIGVSWFRDGKFIVGNIEAGDDRFMTQGRDADEFVDMVNETVYAVYDVPAQYHDVLRKAKREFVPKEDEYALLRNKSVKNSSFLVKKSLKPQLA